MLPRFVPAALAACLGLLAGPAMADVVTPLTACAGGHGMRWCTVAEASQDGRTCAECVDHDSTCSGALEADGYAWSCRSYLHVDGGPTRYLSVYCKDTGPGCSTTSTAAALPLAGVLLLLGLWTFSRGTRRSS